MLPGYLPWIGICGAAALRTLLQWKKLGWRILKVYGLGPWPDIGHPVVLKM